MKDLFCLLFFAIVLFISCGPNAQEKAIQQKIHDDSVALATRNKIQEKKQLEQNIISVKDAIEQLKDALTEAKAESFAALDKMSVIKEWQFGRSSSEREQQVKAQEILIDKATRKITEIEDAIVDAESSKENLQLELKQLE